MNTTSDNYTDSSPYHAPYDEFSVTNPSLRHVPPANCVYYFYDNNSWNEPPVDGNYDPHRMPTSGYSVSPRMDRMRNYYDNQQTPSQFTQTGHFPEYMEPLPAIIGGHQQPPPPPPEQCQLQYYPCYGPGVVVPVKRRDLLQQTLSVNLDASPSYDPRGFDIATNDMGTLRFFYNLGHEYFEQLRMHYGPAAMAQLANVEAKDDESSTKFHQHDDGVYANEMDSIIQKTGNLKLVGKVKHITRSPVHRNESNTRTIGKMAFSKRYSNRNSGMMNDGESGSTGETDPKDGTTDLPKTTPPPLMHKSKESMDKTTNEYKTTHPPMQQAYETLHTPNQRFAGGTEQHPPPLLRTPVPLDSGNGHAANQMVDMQPITAPFIPIPAGSTFQPYMAYYPMEEQVFCLF